MYEMATYSRYRINFLHSHHQYVQAPVAPHPITLGIVTLYDFSHFNGYVVSH